MKLWSGTKNALQSNLSNFTNVVDARIIKTGFDPNTCRSNFQLQHLLRRGELIRARQLFEKMPHKNAWSMNLLISGYVKSGNLSKARELFDSTVNRTPVSWTILIGGYSQNNQQMEAFKLYAEMLRWGTEPDYVTFATLLSGCDDKVTAKDVVQVHAHIIKLGSSRKCQ